MTAGMKVEEDGGERISIYIKLKICGCVCLFVCLLFIQIHTVGRRLAKFCIVVHCLHGEGIAYSENL